MLSLWKSVADAKEVWFAEAELVRALEFLSMAWPFCGGSFMVLETREITKSPRYESTANDAESQLLARLGLSRVEASFTSSILTLATYHEPPLEKASRIARAMLEDSRLRKLLGYHQRAWVEYYARRQTERSSWFVDLYKMREVLENIYGGEQQAKAQLGIPNSDWSYFGAILNNNDLRHAEIMDSAPEVPGENVAGLFRLAWTWIKTHLSRRAASRLTL